MKQYIFIITACIITIGHTYTTDTTTDTSTDVTISEVTTKVEKSDITNTAHGDTSQRKADVHDDEPNNVIYFFTQEDDPEENNPSGQYWQSKVTILDHDKPINSASAYIGSHSYSDVTEEKNQLPHEEIRYLGYFTDPTSQTPIYLYGVKDKIIENDAQEDTIIIPDDDDEDEEFEEEEEEE
jgi:hypothetical protein